MNKYIFAILVCAFFLMIHQFSSAQGCVAVRHFSNFSNPSAGNQAFLQPGEWTLNTDYRYFRSFRHFRGTHEEPERVANNTEVINWQHALDISVSYALTSRLSANVTLPLVYNERSSLYEHAGEGRYTTMASGLADMRVGASYWLLDPYSNPRGNMVVGLGVRLPTGDPAAEDRFYNVGENGISEMRPVDQSIQPGDGGLGFTFELEAGRRITNNVGVFVSGFYLVSPMEMNDTPTNRRVEEAYMSVADQYRLQGGFTFLISENWSASLGGRYEGVPVKDLVGGSEGFRRPGYIWSAEPGIAYSVNRFSISLNVPVALVRARPQSVPDMQISEDTGARRIGDAAFADYLIDIGLTWHFGKSGSGTKTFF